MTATALGLLGPLALMAALGLNAMLLWRAAPAFARALRGARPVLVTARFVPEGESNVVPLRPRVRASEGVRASAGVRAAADRPVRQVAA